MWTVSRSINSSAVRRIRDDRYCTAFGRRRLRRMRRPAHDFASSAELSVVCVAKPCGALGNDVQHWLDIRRRAGDHAQDFTRRSLLLQRFFELLE